MYSNGLVQIARNFDMTTLQGDTKISADIATPLRKDTNAFNQPASTNYSTSDGVTHRLV